MRDEANTGRSHPSSLIPHPSRLLTLTGAGGSGKTRLALQVAAERLEAYRDGVWLVELAALSEPELVPQAVAAALRVQEQAGRPLPATLREHLKPKELLLVLDNCEHLAASCASLVDGLLRGCPDLRILATSRQPLGIAGETEWRVPPLAAPDRRERPSLERLTQYDAVRLFIDRALAAQPAFAVTNENAPAVAQVCQRLDGIPLAIELAAARVGLLSVEQIATRLDHRLRLLTGGSRTALPRQQTLRAAIDWSYNLLSEPERRLLHRLAVFAGGWTLEAAESVCAEAKDEGWGMRDEESQTGAVPLIPHSPSLIPEDVLDRLGGLVDQSLVVAEERAGEARYRLLDTIREYSREKLDTGGETAVRRGRHRDWFLRFAQEAEKGLWSDRQAQWLDWLELEHDNLRFALEWCLSHPDGAEPGLRLAGYLWRFWDLRGYLTEGRRWLEAALARREDAPPESRWLPLQGAGNLARNQSDYERATARYEESLELLQQLGHRRGVGLALINLGNVALDQGDYQRASTLYEQSLVASREVENKLGIALALNNAGVAARNQGDLERARSLHEESLALYREMSDPYGIAMTLDNLGEVAQDAGDPARAIPLHQESLKLRTQLDYTEGIALSHNNLGFAALAQQAPEEARSHHEHALSLMGEIGHQSGIAASLYGLGEVARQREEYGPAAGHYVESLTLFRSVGDPHGIAGCLEGVAVVAAAQRQPARAARLLGTAAAYREAKHAPLRPSRRAGLEAWVQAARAALGEAAFEAAFAEGRSRSPEEAISGEVPEPTRP